MTLEEKLDKITDEYLGRMATPAMIEELRERVVTTLFAFVGEQASDIRVCITHNEGFVDLYIHDDCRRCAHRESCSTYDKLFYGDSNHLSLPPERTVSRLDRLAAFLKALW